MGRSIGVLTADFKANVESFMRDTRKAADGFDKTAKDIAASAKHIQNTFNTLEKVAVAWGIGKAFEGMIDAAKEAETATIKLQGVLKATGGAAGVTEQQVNQMSESLMDLTGVDDDVIKSSSAMMLTFTKIGKNVFPEATKAALDVSAAFGTDLTSATYALGKALQNPETGLKALRKAHISLSAEQETYIKNLAKAGKLEEAQAEILKNVEARVGDMSVVMRDSLDGALKALETSWENFEEHLADQGSFSIARTSVEAMILVIGKFDEALKTNEIKHTFDTIGLAIEQIIHGPLKHLLNALADVGAFALKIGHVFTIGMGIGSANLSGNKKAVEELKKEMTNVVNNEHWMKDWVGEGDKFFAELQKKLDKMHKEAKSAKRPPPVGEEDDDAVKAAKEAADRAKKEEESYDKLLTGLDVEIEKKTAILTLDKDALLHAEAEERVRSLFIGDVDKHQKALSEVEKRMRAMAELESATKRGEIIRSLQEELDITDATLEKDHDRLLTLQAMQKVRGLSKEDQPEATKRYKEGLQEKYDKESDAWYKQTLTSMDREIEKKKAIERLDGDILIDLEAREKLEAKFPTDEKKQLQYLGGMKAELKKGHIDDSQRVWNERYKAAQDETELLRAKIQGTEKLTAAEQKLRDIKKDLYLSPEEQQRQIGLLNKEIEQQDALNKKWERGQKVLGEVSDATLTYNKKLEDLATALAKDDIGTKQFNDALSKLNQNTLSKVQSSVKSFTTNLLDGLTNAITSGKKLSDVMKDIGMQIAKAGVKRFLVDPLANAAGQSAQNFWKNFVLPTAPGVTPTGGGIVAAMLRKINGVGGAGTSPTVATAPGLTNPTISGSNPALASGGMLMSSPAGTAPGVAATASYDNLQMINGTLQAVKTMTPEGPAILVKIANSGSPKLDPLQGSKPTGKGALGDNHPDNIVPFLRRFEGASMEGPAWRVLQADKIGGNVVPISAAKSASGLMSATGSAKTDANAAAQSDSGLSAIGYMLANRIFDMAFWRLFDKKDALLPFLSGLVGQTSMGPGLRVLQPDALPGAAAAAAAESEKLLPFLRPIVVQTEMGPAWRVVFPSKWNGDPGELTPGTSKPADPVADLLRRVIDPGKGVVQVVDQNPCPPSRATGAGGSCGSCNKTCPLAGGVRKTGSGGRGRPGYQPMTPHYAPTGGGGGNILAPLLQAAAQANAEMNSLFSNSGGNMLQGLVSALGGGGSTGGSSGGTTATGTVNGKLLTPVTGPAYRDTTISNTGTAPKYQPTGNELLGVAGTQNALAVAKQKAMAYYRQQAAGGNMSALQVSLMDGYWDNLFSTAVWKGSNMSQNTINNWIPGMGQQQNVAYMGYNLGGGGGIQQQVNTGDGGMFTPGAIDPLYTGTSGGTFFKGDNTFFKNMTGGPQIKEYGWQSDSPYNIGPGVNEWGDTSIVSGQLLGYADGGDPPIGRPSWVGERGKELFVPREPGTVVNHENSLKLLRGGQSTPNVQIVNNGHPIQPSSTEWDGETLKMVVGNVIESIPNHQGFQRAQRQVTGVKPAPRRRG